LVAQPEDPPRFRPFDLRDRIALIGTYSGSSEEHFRGCVADAMLAHLPAGASRPMAASEATEARLRMHLTTAEPGQSRPRAPVTEEGFTWAVLLEDRTHDVRNPFRAVGAGFSAGFFLVQETDRNLLLSARIVDLVDGKEGVVQVSEQMPGQSVGLMVLVVVPVPYYRVSAARDAMRLCTTLGQAIGTAIAAR
jgi:hypothetical protein